MKIVNEKGKLFGIINIVDLIVVLLVVAIVGVVGTQLLGSKVTDAVSQQVDCYAQVRIIGAHPYMLTDVENKDLKGQRMVSGNSYLGATIEDVWFEDYWITATTDDGQIVTATDPVKKDIIFLVKTQVAPDTASPKIGSQELRSGRTFIVKTQTYECSGTIRYVEIGGYNPPAEFANK